MNSMDLFLSISAMKIWIHLQLSQQSKKTFFFIISSSLFADSEFREK